MRGRTPPMPSQGEFNGSVFVFPDDYAHASRSDATGAAKQESSVVSRKAEESANRRYLAALWMEEVVGPLHLSVEPSEEEFGRCLRNGISLCKLVNSVQPGSVSRVVESCSSSPADGALSAYQYFENVRNFLVAVEDLSIPTFDASDLEEASFGGGSVARVVDCILGLKLYHEWKGRGGQGQWKHSSKQKSLLTLSLEEGEKCSSLTKSRSFSGKSGRKRCVLPELDFLGETQLLFPDEPPEFQASRQNYGGQPAYAKNLNAPSDISRQTASGLENRDWQSSIFESFDGIENQSPALLSNTIRSLLSQKQPDEIPMVVEFMLQKIMEDYRRRFYAQNLQLKKLKNALKEASGRGSMDIEEGPQNDGKIMYDQFKLIKDLKNAWHKTKQDVLAMRRDWNLEVAHLESHIKGLAAAASGYQKVLLENRKLYNEVQDLKGSIRVYCRVRPLLSGDLSRRTTVEFIGENGDVMISNPKRQGKDACRTFKFNKVFSTSASQEQVFLDTQPLIRSVLDGYNVCIFAYGQTGSGKTYTMSGPSNATEDLWGVNYRALNDLFYISQSRRNVCKYDIGVQMVEIYNEQIRDLLASDGPTKKLEIRNSCHQNGLNVPNAIMLAVTSTVDVLELMKSGEKNRAIGATALNERSSRSHSVLTIHVQGKDLVTGTILRGCLHLIDLAGSERVNKSEATGDRLKEAQHINKSLSALGDVISALSQKNGHVPYRNSKLTQLLQDSLGGQAKTLMFVHINPDADSFGETMSTLKFAERVASIELGAARSNKETGELQDLKEQIMILKDSLSKKDADLDKLLLLRNVKESTLALEKQRHEPKIRKQFTDTFKARENSPVRDRARRLSPPGNTFGFELDRVSSPSKGDMATEQQKRKGIKAKLLTSPKPPYEDFAPKSPYRERHHRSKNSQSKTRGSSVFLVESPPCLEERRKSPDVDGFINTEAELSRDSPVLRSPAFDPAVEEPSISYSTANNEQYSCNDPSLPAVTVVDHQSATSSSDLKDTCSDVVVTDMPPSDCEADKIQRSETVEERVETISETVYETQTPQLQRVDEQPREEKRSQNRSRTGSTRSRKGQSVSCVRRRSTIVTSRTEPPIIRRSSSSIPLSARHTTLECHGHGKQAFSRQLLSIETGISPKASKRYPWMVKQIKLSAMIA
ncbi:kinesin-like protein KIN-14I isoform X1 [Selaginella moellendorffii]|uniref:kinesin-like protein KIN-14I isoform X1 n=1 Tax=Selaginella moellendorffii TaxID=88036 RepID=UPI000D1C4D51|nr:kinesin-like protein KIN-14I isoform X1 [Selaginella moellendorffii]|eukprot:XP_024516224.1 kinesin-like protein KIN-14I isoform X1 [Selaginella moellendorffii]